MKKNPETQQIQSKQNPEISPNISHETEKLSDDILQKMSNREFLNIQRDTRLQHITEPSKKSSDINQWDDIIFTFQFNGKRNPNLFLKTTAWQVLPEKVQEVEFLWASWHRNGPLWEFFDKNGHRLIIRDATKIKISKIVSSEDISRTALAVENGIKDYRNDSNYELILEAAKRNIDPKIAIALFSQQIKNSDNQKVTIEEFITEFERTKDYFSSDYPTRTISSGNIPSGEFLSYYLSEQKWDNIQKIREELGIKDELSRNYSRKERAKAFQGFKKMEELTPAEKISLSDVSSETINLWKSECFGKKFVPGSKETQQLFTCAAIMAWLPKEWGTNENLHNILQNESAGIVGRANYTLTNSGISGQGLKYKAIENSNLAGKNIASVVGVSSTAVWLWQLTLSNEHYLPHGRSSIGIPLEEAIGMLRYMKDRYGSPDVAWSIYGKMWYYTHADTWKSIPKEFKEGY